MIGERIGQYELVGKLGEGGMGVVYRAIDTRLGRPVAVKVVSERMMRDAEGHARLMREARMAAALNHPNVCTIHDVLDLAPAQAAEEDGPGAAIVFELVEGQTLAAKIAASGALPAAELLDVAVQIADGLSAAHTRHIVHRDLKPQNVIITPEGRVKILDFGLARLSAAATPDPDLSTRTDFDLSRQAGSEGATRGTVPYMSPEQAAGKPLDHRSDIFSFGIVLFEMATGQRPFRGDTAVEILSKVLEAEAPDLTRARADLPVAMGRVVRRCLQKRPDERYQDTRDVLADLRDIHLSLRSSTGEVSPATVVHETRGPELARAEARRGLAKWRVAIAVAAGATAIGVAAILMTLSGGGAPPAAATHRQITFVGDASLPALSPDGAFVAYVRGEPWGDFSETVGPRQPQRIVIHDLAGGGRDIEVGECRHCLPPVWSPDGKSLLIANEDGRLSIVPRLGGSPRRFDAYGSAAWSPNGAEFAHMTASAREISFVTIETTRRRLVPLSWSYSWVHGIDWAPASQLAVMTTDANGVSEIWIVSPDGAQQRQVVRETRRVRSVRWAPGGDTLYYVRGDGADELVAVRFSQSTGKATEPPAAIVSGVSMGPHVSLSADGQTLIYTRELRFANLWSAPIGDGPAKPAQLTTGSSVDQFPSVSPDGATLAFVRGAGQVSNVFTMAVDGSGAPRQLSFLGATNGAPAWSPDGGSLAFCAALRDERVVWTFDLARSTPRSYDATRCPSSGAETPIVWAPRREILYQRPGNRNYHILDPETGVESLLIGDETLGWIFAPLTAPDGTQVAAFWNRKRPEDTDRTPGIWLLSPSAGEPTLLLSGFAWPLGWSTDSRTLYAYKAQAAEIVAVPRDGSSAKVLARLEASRIGLAPALTPDRRRVIYSVHAIHADVWTVENFDARRSR